MIREPIDIVEGVSVIVPCRDGHAKRLTNTVVSAIKAGCGDIVIVDDGSEKIPAAFALGR
jgi:hypothetical protein